MNTEEMKDARVRDAERRRLMEIQEKGETLTDEDLESLQALIEYDDAQYRKAQEQREARLAAQDPTNRESYDRSGPGMVDSFLEKVQTNTFEPIKSGLPTLDERLGGGFIRQSVILLGSAPGMGKTALMQQICEYIAAKEKLPVLYFNLEMSREVMLARSLTKIIYNNYGNKVLSVTDILQGYNWDKKPGRRKIVYDAADQYKAQIAPYLVYNPKDKISDLDQILAEVEKRKAELQKQGYPAPILCIDYLQLITSSREGERDTVEIIKRTMRELKTYANQNDTLVFIVSANNRSSNQNGRSDLNSGRDTSTIEYGADLHMGIEYDALRPRMLPDGAGGWTEAPLASLDHINAVKAKYFEYLDSIEKYGNLYASEYGDIQKEYRALCAPQNIRINKNRYYHAGTYARFIFEGEATMFRELNEEERRAEKARAKLQIIRENQQKK